MPPPTSCPTSSLFPHANRSLRPQSKRAAGSLQPFSHSRLRARRSALRLKSQVCDQFLTTQMTKSVLQLHELDEQVVLRIQARRAPRGLEVEAQPLLDAAAPQLRCALRQIEGHDEGEHNGRRQD